MRLCLIFGFGFAEILFYFVVLHFYKTRRFAVFRHFRVISMRFAVFLCYSVWCLYLILSVLGYLYPTYAPLSMVQDNNQGYHLHIDSLLQSTCNK